jgi:hypothetical protein
MQLRREPVPHRRAQLGQPGAEAVVTGHKYDVAALARRRDAERIALPLDDEHRNGDGVELVEAALLGPARRVQREREAADRHGACLGRRATGHARAGRAAADHERQARELLGAQVREDREPRRVELMRRSGGAASGEAIRLLDEGYRDAERDRLVGRGDEVARVDATARTVAEHERGARLVHATQVRPREAAGRLDLDALHRVILPQMSTLLPERRH